jgi:hypothetical protein
VIYPVGIGASLGHFSNIFLSVIIANALQSQSGDQCLWYCLTYIVDSTFGILWNLICLQIFELIMIQFPSLFVIFNFGNYGTPPKLYIFFPQLLVWLLIVISGKLIIIMVIYQFIFPINAVMNYVFHEILGVSSHPQLELVLVMVIIPGTLNVIQFWVTDTFLKQQITVDSDGEIVEELIGSVGESFLI